VISTYLTAIGSLPSGRYVRMHQHPRPPPQMASPASSPTTNPTRTNNQREEGRFTHSRVGSETPTYNEADEGGVASPGSTSAAPGPSKDAVKKLDQIIQVFTTEIELHT
jgi:autophagy-related protein 13